MDNKQLTEEERSEYLRILNAWDVEDIDEESAHSGADRILCEALTKLGYSDIVDAWDKIKKWSA